VDKWWVYIVEKKIGLYVGITTDLENRMRQHGQRGKIEGSVQEFRKYLLTASLIL